MEDTNISNHCVTRQAHSIINWNTLMEVHVAVLDQKLFYDYYCIYVFKHSYNFIK